MMATTSGAAGRHRPLLEDLTFVSVGSSEVQLRLRQTSLSTLNRGIPASSQLSNVHVRLNATVSRNCDAEIGLMSLSRW